MTELRRAVPVPDRETDGSGAGADDRSPRSLVAPSRILANIEFVLDGLALLKIVEVRPLDRGQVKEHLPAITANEPESPVRDNLLDDTTGHCTHSS